jgi:hypothetical protein
MGQNPRQTVSTDKSPTRIGVKLRPLFFGHFTPFDPILTGLPHVASQAIGFTRRNTRRMSGTLASALSRCRNEVEPDTADPEDAALRQENAHRGIWVGPSVLAEIAYRAKSAEGESAPSVLQGRPRGSFIEPSFGLLELPLATLFFEKSSYQWFGSLWTARSMNELR